ncbi:MAG: hypothetical protein H0T89_03875 [Deltaproteobacteria bacterium]|nr:hypothetical protein [Deltaproteobacteria bacterium]MDQ3298053.1 hypothetical protein [Myxococcota bacterium]
MVRHPLVIASFLAFVVPACGGDDKKKTTPKKVAVTKKKEAPPPKETEEDRENQREAAANKIIPTDSTCLPMALKEDGAPRLELGAIGADAVICAVDTDPSRLLGVAGCWKIDLASGELAYRKRAPIPGRGVTVKITNNCAWSFCLPKDAASDAEVAQLTTNIDGSKTAALVGDEVHIFDSGSKEHASKFSIRGDKGVTGDVTRLNWVGDSLFVESNDAVYVFKAEGTAVGAIEPIGGKDGKPASMLGGSMSVLDKTRVAVSEHGFSTVTTYEADTGKRAKLVRKTTKAPCKDAELEAYWKGADGVGAKCKAFMTKNFGPLVGADAVSGSKNLLVLLRGPRLGELAVLDAKSLAEKKAIKLPWCEGKDEGDAEGESDSAASE